MRIENLLNVGTYSGAQRLRAVTAHAISFAETVTRYRDVEANGPAPFAVKLAAFLSDAASKVPGYEAPLPSLEDDEAIVENGATVTVGGVEATLSVADNELTGASLPATAAVVTNGATIEIEGVTYTFTVAGGEITAVTVDEGA